MITNGKTKVIMGFDSGQYTNRFIIVNPALTDNTSNDKFLDKDLIQDLEIGISSIVEAMINNKLRREKRN